MKWMQPHKKIHLPSKNFGRQNLEFRIKAIDKLLSQNYSAAWYLPEDEYYKPAYEIASSHAKTFSLIERILQDIDIPEPGQLMDKKKKGKNLHDKVDYSYFYKVKDQIIDLVNPEWIYAAQKYPEAAGPLKEIDTIYFDSKNPNPWANAYTRLKHYFIGNIHPEAKISLNAKENGNTVSTVGLPPSRDFSKADLPKNAAGTLVVKILQNGMLHKLELFTKIIEYEDRDITMEPRFGYYKIMARPI